MAQQLDWTSTSVLKCTSNRHKSQNALASVFLNFGRFFLLNLSFNNGNFKSIFGHFFGNYMNIFHKTEIQTVI